MKIENKILKILSEIDVCYLTCGRAISSKEISNILNYPYNDIKRIMRSLRYKGLIQYENKVYNVCDDYWTGEYHKFRNRGWLISKKGTETAIWKKANEKEQQIFNNCFRKDANNEYN